MLYELKDDQIVPINVVNGLLSKRHDLKEPLKIRCDGKSITKITEFNKVKYLVYKGKLRQFKIKRGIKYPFFSNVCVGRISVNNLLIVDIAGLGEVGVLANTYGYTFNFYVYDSVEDFKKKNAATLGETYLKEETLKRIYANDGSFDDCGVFCRYYWDGVMAKPYTPKHDVSLFFTYDKNGFDTNMPTFYEGYPTKEECEKDNTIQVEYLNDEADNEKDSLNVVIHVSVEINGVKSVVADDDTLAKVKNILKI